MKVLRNVSKALQRYASLKYILITLGIFITTVAFMEAGPASSKELKVLSGGMGMLDMLFCYSQQQAYTMLDSIGEHGRFIYTALLGIDFIFAVAFMLFQSLIITLLMRRAGLLERFGILNMLPFLRSGLDILENVMLLTMIYNYPVRLRAAAILASVFTLSKWIVFYALIALLFILITSLIRKKLFTKKKMRSFP